MKKVKSVIGAVLVLALFLMMFSAIPVMAKEDRSVSGTWIGTSPPVVLSSRHAGANVVADVSAQGKYVSGDILGTFEHTLKIVNHYGSPEVVANLNPGNPASNPEVAFSWIDMQRTSTGSVLGISGEFTMRLQATGYGNYYKGNAYYDMHGTWVILSGSGDLTNIHGQGTWWHSRTGPNGLQYEGQIHFEP